MKYYGLYPGGIGMKGELLAICKEDNDEEAFIRRRNSNHVLKELCSYGDEVGIYWLGITQAEFGTYQAFGIKEIKL